MWSGSTQSLGNVAMDNEHGMPDIQMKNHTNRSFVLRPVGPGLTERKYVTPVDGITWKLKEIEEIVGGNIHPQILDNEMIMFINMEGKSNGLPLNEEASLIFVNKTRIGEVIVGTVLVTPGGMVKEKNINE